MKKTLSRTDEPRDKTRVLKGRSLLSLIEVRRKLAADERPRHPYLLTSRPDEIHALYWTLALPVRKKTPDERGADDRKTLEVSDRLQQILLDDAYVYVGRSRENDITLTPKSVSRLHACFSIREGVWIVTDIGSANGTVIDGHVITEGQSFSVGRLSKISFGPDAVFYFATAEVMDDLVNRFLEHEKSLETNDRIELPKPPAARSKPVNPNSTVDDLVSIFPLSSSRDDKVQPSPASEIESALSALEGMFGLVAQVSVVLTIKDQTIVLYDAADASGRSDLGSTIRALKELVRSINVSLSSGDGRPFEIYARS